MKNNRFLISMFFFNIFLTNLYAEVLLFSKAYNMALENAHGIKASVYLSQIDKEKIIQERSQLYPQINLSAFYKTTAYELNPAYGGNKTEQNLMNYTLSLKQSIYNPSIYSRINLQKSKSEYSQAKVELEKEELAQNLFNAYIDVLKSKNKIELLKSYKEYNYYKLQEITKKYEMELSTKMDLLQIKVEYSSIQIDLNKEKKLFDIYYLKLKQFIGNEEYNLPTINSEKSIEDMIALMKEKIVSDKKSLKIVQAQVAVKISKAEIKHATYEHLPKFNFDAAYSKYETDDPNYESQYDNTKYVMLTLNMPIFSGGSTSSKITSAKLMHKASMEDLLSMEKKVQVQHDEYLALFEASTESVSMYKEALSSAELYVEAITQGYDYGLKSITDLNDAKNKFYEVKYKYIENIYEMVNSYIGLLIVTNSVDDITILDSLVE